MPNGTNKSHACLGVQTTLRKAILWAEAGDVPRVASLLSQLRAVAAAAVAAHDVSLAKTKDVRSDSTPVKLSHESAGSSNRCGSAKAAISQNHLTRLRIFCSVPTTCRL